MAKLQVIDKAFEPFLPERFSGKWPMSQNEVTKSEIRRKPATHRFLTTDAS